MFTINDLSRIPPQKLVHLFVDGHFLHKEQGWKKFASREPGCIQAFFNGLQYLVENPNKLLSVDLLKDLHKLVSHKVTLEANVVPGEFREPFRGAGSFGVNYASATAAGIEEVLKHIKNPPYLASRALIDLAGDANEIYNQVKQTGFTYSVPAIKEDSSVTVEDEVSAIVDNYKSQIEQCETLDDKIKCIVTHIQLLERFHPFPDCNLRTLIQLTLNHLLMQQGFPPAIFYNPNVFDMYSVDQLVEIVKEGIGFTLELMEKEDAKIFGYDGEDAPEEMSDLTDNLCDALQSHGETQSRTSEQTDELQTDELKEYLLTGRSESIKLHRAAVEGDLEALQYVNDVNDANGLNKPAPEDVNPLYKGRSPLQLACAFNQKDFVHKLLEGIDGVEAVMIDQVDNDGNTALHHAMIANSSELVNLLVNKGAALTIKNRNGDAALDMAVKYSNPEVFATLVAVADKKDLTIDYDRCLLQAATTGNIEMIEALLDTYRADLHTKNESGETPLMLALKKGTVDSASFLLDRESLMESEASEKEFIATCEALLEAAMQNTDPALLKLVVATLDKIENEKNCEIISSFNEELQINMLTAFASRDIEGLNHFLKRFEPAKKYITTAMTYLAMEERTESCRILLKVPGIGKYLKNEAAKEDVSSLVYACKSHEIIFLLNDAGLEVCAIVEPETGGNYLHFLAQAPTDVPGEGIKILNYLRDNTTRETMKKAVNNVDGENRTPLEIALENAIEIAQENEIEKATENAIKDKPRLEFIQDLLKCGVALSPQTTSNRSAFFPPSVDTDLDAVTERVLSSAFSLEPIYLKTILEHSPISKKLLTEVLKTQFTEDIKSPHACENIKLLLKHGADFNAVKNPLHILAEMNAPGRKELAAELIERGVDINASTHPEGTALHVALDGVYHDNLSFITFLIDNGIDLTKEDGRTKEDGHGKTASEYLEQYHASDSEKVKDFLFSKISNTVGPKQ